MDTQPSGSWRSNPLLDRHSVIAAAFAVVALLVPMLIGPWGPGPGPDPSASSSSPGASASRPGASPTVGPSATPGEPWEPLSLEPFTETATLAADATDAAGVRPETRFTLGSLTIEPAAELAKRLEIEPATDIRVSPGADESHVTLAPAAPLTPGQVYRVALRDPDGTLTASWAFRVRGPLHIIGTIPGDEMTRVPLSAGIEVTFDQEDVADIAEYLTIEPDVTGRFERHGRTQVFVPSRLAPATLYTVTVRAGLPRTGTELTLERELVFRFETEGDRPPGQRWIAGRDVIEASPAEPPVIGIVAPFSVGPDGAALPIPPTALVKVFRFPSENAALDALEPFLDGERWAMYNEPTIQTGGLEQERTFTATLEVVPHPWEEESNHRIVRFPEALAAGWYAVEIVGDDSAFVFLQVTRVSAWVSVLTDRTIVWVNDVVTHRPIAGATAAAVGSGVFGTSGVDGILNGPTPAALLPAAVSSDEPATAPIIVVRSGSDTLFVPFDVAYEYGLYRGEWWEQWGSADETYWTLLSTDRSAYRTTDTIALWGYLRGRDDDDVPDSVELRVVPGSSQELDRPPTIAGATVALDPVGLFSARLPIDRAPLGGYAVEAVLDGRVVASVWIEVKVIRKPEFQLAVARDHLAAIAGTSVRLTATATFFDGTPVAGLSLRVWYGGEEDLGFDLTDRQGVTSGVVPMLPWDDDDVTREQWIAARPTGPETGEISAGTSVLVFAASEHIAATGSIANGRLRVTGSLRTVDLASVERELSASGAWSGDPGGPGIAGRTIKVAVTELIWVQTQVGTRYDFIEKVVVPVYRYETLRREVPTRTTTVISGTDGRIGLDLEIPDPTHEYEVRFETQDQARRRVVRLITVGSGQDPVRWSDEVTFRTSTGSVPGEERFGVGDPIRWTMTANDEPLPSNGPDRYLYVVAQRGLVDVRASGSPTFERTFRESDAPGIYIMGVRFTGTTYAPKAAAWADLDLESRRIRVGVTADRERYRPGDEITLRVRTTDQDGRPIAANVVVQAVDEKIYAMGAAYTPDPLWTLYGRVDSGIVRLGATHQVPATTRGEGEGGDEGGGGDRSDFRDMLVFTRLRTNADGIATTTFRASDDLTSWHVAAFALTAGLEAGVGELLVPVGLPFFASVTVADEYLLADRPSVRMRAFGSDLRAGDPVVFTISSVSLGLSPVTIESTAFMETWVDLPTLRLGRQTLDVSVVSPTRKDAAGKPLTDRLITTFEVVETRLSVAKAGYGLVGGSPPAVPDGVAAAFTFTDAGRGRYLPLLLDLVESTSGRLDRGLAGVMARAMLTDAFGRDPATLPPDTFDPSRYPIEVAIPHEYRIVSEPWRIFGVALVPFGGPDPWLATRVAIGAPTSPVARDLRSSLIAVRDDPSQPRELRVAAVAALASLGEPVFGDVAELSTLSDLTPFERIHVGLAAAAVGDDATARSFERSLLEEFGERLGPWVRIGATSDRDDAAEMTALLALLAARIGDPLAPAMLDYVWTHPSAETSHALETAATVSALLERTPAARASFAYTVDGARSVVDIPAGSAVTLALTAAQRSSLVLERVSGEVGMAIAWRETTDPSAIEPDPSIGVRRRSLEPITADRLVVVDLHVTFAPDALASGCYAVVEQVPSGLAPLEEPYGQVRDPDARTIWPSRIAGQEVSFCVPWSPPATQLTLRYVARVVSTGTFTWEPAVMTLDGVPEVIAVTAGSTIQIAR